MVGPLGRGDGGGSWLFEMMMLLDDGRWCQVSLFWFHRMCQLTYANFLAILILSYRNIEPTFANLRKKDRRSKIQSTTEDE